MPCPEPCPWAREQATLDAAPRTHIHAMPCPEPRPKPCPQGQAILDAAPRMASVTTSEPCKLLLLRADYGDERNGDRFRDFLRLVCFICICL